MDALDALDALDLEYGCWMTCERSVRLEYPQHKVGGLRFADLPGRRCPSFVGCIPARLYRRTGCSSANGKPVAQSAPEGLKDLLTYSDQRGTVV